MGRVVEYLDRLSKMGFAGSVFVMRGDDVVLMRGYGLADREQGRSMRPESVVDLGSLTKQFTAAAVLKLQELGKLRTSDSLGRFFSGVPEDKAGVTVHHLLTHSSGLPDVIGDDHDTTDTRVVLLRRILQSEPVAEPGVRYRYSNAGYSLLGMIIEDASGMPYETFLRDSILAPAGLTKTGYVLPRFTPDEIAVGYVNDERWGTTLGRPMLGDGPSWNLRANGGLHSTAADMARWVVALRADRVLSAASRGLMETPHIDEGGGESFYGYGWAIDRGPGDSRRVWHDGSNNVYTARLDRYVDEDLAIFAASTDPHFGASILTEIIRTVMTGGEYELPPAVVESPVRIQQYAGRFVLPRDGGALRIATSEGKLMIAAEGCGAEAVVSGAGATLPDSVTPLVRRTVEVFRQSAAGDYGPLGALLAADAPEVRARTIDRQKDYLDRQRERAGPVRSVSLEGCSHRGDQLRVVVLFEHERGKWYRSLRWRGGHMVGYGLHGEAPVPPNPLPAYPTGAHRFSAFHLGGSTITLAYELVGSAPASVTVGSALGEVRATRASP